MFFSNTKTNGLLISALLFLGAIFIVNHALAQEQGSAKAANEKNISIPSLEDLRKAYDLWSKSSGHVTGTMYEWVKEDIQNMFALEYQVLSLTDNSDKDLGQKLTELGKERWDCSHLNSRSTGDTNGLNSIRFLCKRSKKSYFGALPVKDLLKALGAAGDGN